MKAFVIAALALTVFLSSVPAQAHHSFNTFWFMYKTMEIQGVARSFKLVSPHSEMMLGTFNAVAQSNEEFDKVYPFVGHWSIFSTNTEGEDRGNCGGRLGDAGEKALNCSMPIDQLPLNKRGEAWLKFVDQRNSPSIAECAQVAIPSLLTSDNFISAFPGRL